jgi:diaminopimelate decarboxylase
MTNHELDRTLFIVFQGHLGSCIYDPGVYRCIGEIMTDMTNQLKSRGYSINILNIGGGIGIDYHLKTPGIEEYLDNDDLSIDKDHQAPAELSEFIKIISDTIPAGITVILEPGRSLVIGPASYEKALK